MRGLGLELALSLLTHCIRQVESHSQPKVKDGEIHMAKSVTKKKSRTGATKAP